MRYPLMLGLCCIAACAHHARRPVELGHGTYLYSVSGRDPSRVLTRATRLAAHHCASMGQGVAVDGSSEMPHPRHMEIQLTFHCVPAAKGAVIPVHTPEDDADALHDETDKDANVAP